MCQLPFLNITAYERGINLFMNEYLAECAALEKKENLMKKLKKMPKQTQNNNNNNKKKTKMPWGTWKE
eukprot:2108974-Ditylum_brightwellii.AAC.1